MHRLFAFETRGPDGRVRLIAQRPAGDPLPLYEAPSDAERQHRVRLGPNGRWAVITETGGPTARVGLLDLHADALRWLPPPAGGPWDLRAPVLSDDGQRLCVAARPAGLPLAELFVYALDGAHPEVIAGVALEGRHQPRCPVFLPGGRQLIYLRETDGGGCELALLELDRAGESAHGIQGAAPSVLRLTLTNGAQARTDVSPSYSPVGRRTAFTVDAKGGRRGLMVFSPGGAPRPVVGVWDHLDALAADPAGRWLAFCDGDALWLAQLDAPHRGARPIEGGPPNGALRWADGQLHFARGPHACALDPESGEVRIEGDVGPGVTTTFALPADVRALARIARLGLEAPDQLSDAAVAARADLHTWFEGLGVLPDPVPAFEALAELADDPLVCHLVDAHLATQALRAQIEPAATTDLLFALAAAAGIGVGRGTMRPLCAEAGDRLAETPSLPKRPAFLALCALEAPPFVLADALAAYAALQAEWRAALALPETPGRAKVEALIDGLRRRLAAVAEGTEEPVPLLGVDPADVDVVARFAADRAAAEAAHTRQREAAQARTERARAAREAAGRAHAIDRERAQREAVVARARAEADAARAEREALIATREARKQREAAEVVSNDERLQVAALAAAAAHRAEADQLTGHLDDPAPPPPHPDRGRLEARAEVAETARAVAERARDLAEAERAAALAARDAAEVEAQAAIAAQVAAEGALGGVEATVATLQSRLKNVEARRTAQAAEARDDTSRLQAALDAALTDKEAAEIHALQVAEAHKGGSPLVPLALAALLAAGGVIGLELAVLAVPPWVGAAVGGALGGLLGGLLIRP